MENEIRKGNEVKVEAKIRNPNHPQKGDNTRVDPLRKLEDVQAVKKLLSDNPRDLLLFTMGINNGLRVGDLLRLRVKDVKHLKEGGPLSSRRVKRTGRIPVPSPE